MAPNIQLQEKKSGFKRKNAFIFWIELEIAEGNPSKMQTSWKM